MCVHVRDLCLLTHLTRWGQKKSNLIKLPFLGHSCTCSEKKYNKWCQKALKRCTYCTMLFETLWGATDSMLHTSRENKHSRQVFRIFYSVPFYFIQYVCLSTKQFFFCLPPFTATQTMSHGSYTCGCMCRSAQCPAGMRLVTPNLCSSLIASFSLIVPLLNAEKNRYPLINSKAVKILSSPKGRVSSVEVSNQSLPWWNEKVAPSGKKSWLVASCNKRCSASAPHQRRETTQCKWHVSLKTMNILCTYTQFGENCLSLSVMVMTSLIKRI